jgi:hypothetical protein
MSFPRTTDLELKQDGEAFINNVATAPTTFNLTAAIVSALEATKDEYEDALGICLDPDSRTRGSIQAKNTAKKPYVQALRDAAALVQIGPNTTDQMRRDLGLPVHDKRPSPVGPPDTFPIPTLVPQGAARNKLRIVDSGTPGKRKRPKGAVAAEVRFAVVATPETVPATWDKTMFITRALSDVENPEADAGKTLVCQGRWIGSKGQVGPWGPVETGTIAA